MQTSTLNIVDVRHNYMELCEKIYISLDRKSGHLFLGLLKVLTDTLTTYMDTPDTIIHHPICPVLLVRADNHKQRIDRSDPCKNTQHTTHKIILYIIPQKFSVTKCLC